MKEKTKNTLILLTAILSTLLITSLFWLGIQRTQEMQLKSDVYYPLKSIISNIQSEINENNNPELIRRKIDLLNESWMNFIEKDGKTPELFENEIIMLK